MAKLDQSRVPQPPDPFAAAFGEPAATSATSTPVRTKPWTPLERLVVGPDAPEPGAAPATPSGGTSDAFDAAFGPLGADGRVSAPAKPSADLGMGHALAGGIIEGIPIAGPTIKKGLDEGLAYLRSLGTGRTVEEERQAMQEMDRSTKATHPTAEALGEVTGQVAGYGAAAVAAPAAFGIGMALPEAAVASGATNALLSASDAYMRGEDPTKAGLTGGALGVAAPVIGQAVGHLFTNYVQPEVARLADLAINHFYIPLGPDLISTNPMVRFASSVMDRMPFTGGGAAREARAASFTRAVAQQMGENADALTPDVMRNARTRIGQGFEYAARNTPQIGADQQFGNDLTRVWDEVTNPVDRALTSDERRVVEGHLRRVVDLFSRGNGSITGQQFQQMTRRGTALDRATGSDNPNIRHYAIQIEGALNDALLRFAPADAADTLRTARQQWWAMKTVEDLAEKATDGRISPALLMQKVRSNTHDMAFGGGGDMAELARIGQLFLKESPSSGTAERSFIMKLLPEAMAGGGLWALFHHPVAGAIGAAAPIIAGQVARVARNPRIGNALVRGAIQGPGQVSQAVRAAGRAALPGLVQQARPLLDNVIRGDKSVSQ